MTTPQTNHSEEESVGVLEEGVSVMPMLFPAAVMSQIIFVATFPFTFFGIRLHVFSFLPFFISYCLSYLIAFFVVFGILALWYHSKTLHMKVFEDITIFGISPTLVQTRTGVKYIDSVGLALASVVFIISFLSPSLNFLCPFWLFGAIAFFSGLRNGNSRQWTLKRRRLGKEE
jgi:hypothetical protein